MKTITSYHRPAALEEAIALLSRTEVATKVIAGGTALNGAPTDSLFEVVDIQAAVGASVERMDDRVRYGAMARLQDVIDNPATPPLIADLAKREGPNTFRNASTIGGTIAEAHFESELLVGLLVHDAIVSIAGPGGSTEMAIDQLMADRKPLDHGIITAVSVVMGGETASARTGRTPADASIVAAAGRVVATGLSVAATGVAATPVLVDPDNLNALNPPADFRGTSEYRSHLAKVLVARVVSDLGGAA